MIYQESNLFLLKTPTLGGTRYTVQFGQTTLSSDHSVYFVL